MGFLRLLLLFILIYLIFRFLGRLFIGVSHAQNSGARSYNDMHGNPSREGDVSIKYKPGKRKKIIHESDGEYVRFEEMEDGKE